VNSQAKAGRKRNVRATAPATTLDRRTLNRALLARQWLLERAKVPAIDAIQHLLGLQAQVPSDPYFGLWSRLADFDPEELSKLLSERQAVRMVAQRGTLHLLSAEDALHLRSWVQPVLTRTLASTPFGRNTRDVDLDALVARGRKALETEPLTLAQLRPILASRFPGVDPVSLSYVVHYTLPLVQVPPRGLWRKSGQPRVTTAESWLGRRLAKPAPEQMIRRYLQAFGPASVQDAQAWSGLTRLDAVFEKLRAELVTFRDASGRELFDLPEAPRPDPGTPAPPRFLPVYENLVLGLADRDRILSAGPTMPRAENMTVKCFLIDGFTAGYWRIEEDRREASLILQPFGRLSRSDRAALEEEGEKLLAFAAEAPRHKIKLVR
jgi:hypothetical protein